MRNPARIIYVAMAGALLLGGGCVMKSKYEATVAQLDKCKADGDACRKHGEEVGSQLATVTGERDAARKDAEEQKNGREKAENENKAYASQLGTTQKELEELRQKRAEAEKRLQAMRDLTAKFRKMIDSGKIKVVFRGGRMILKLPAGILFASGKAELSKEGQEALAEVATILKEFPDRHFIVAGHTDNVPLGQSKYKDNWELSTARALTVTKFLIAQGVDPKVLSAAGYGEFDPVADNTKDDGRQENRRIEIILVPNIEELPGLPEDTAGGAAPAPGTN